MLWRPLAQPRKLGKSCRRHDPTIHYGRIKKIVLIYTQKNFPCTNWNTNIPSGIIHNSSKGRGPQGLICWMRTWNVTLHQEGRLLFLLKVSTASDELRCRFTQICHSIFYLPVTCPRCSVAPPCPSAGPHSSCSLPLLSRHVPSIIFSLTHWSHFNLTKGTHFPAAVFTPFLWLK